MLTGVVTNKAVSRHLIYLLVWHVHSAWYGLCVNTASRWSTASQGGTEVCGLKLLRAKAALIAATRICLPQYP